MEIFGPDPYHYKSKVVYNLCYNQSVTQDGAYPLDLTTEPSKKGLRFGQTKTVEWSQCRAVFVEECRCVKREGASTE
jgi:hypothetical protein